VSASWRRPARRSLEVVLQGVLVGLAVVVAGIVVKGPAARSSPRAPAVRPAGTSTPAVTASPAPPADPAQIRDVFRFADDPIPAAPARLETDVSPGQAAASPAPTPPGPRLVGLVRRAGRLVAALAADGEVVIAGPGETAAGVTVLSVGEDGVRVRHADGREETLLLP
jgi:hypothetical protein